MKFGLSTLTRGIFTAPEAYVAVAKAAEKAGFDFLSVSDHLIVPKRLTSHYPYAEGGVFGAAEHGHCFDQLSTVAFLAGSTQKLRLLTSVISFGSTSSVPPDALDPNTMPSTRRCASARTGNTKRPSRSVYNLSRSTSA